MNEKEMSVTEQEREREREREQIGPIKFHGDVCPKMVVVPSLYLDNKERRGKFLISQTHHYLKGMPCFHPLLQS